MLWDRAFDGGCDRLAISPDGKILYVPSFEGPHWTRGRRATGDVIAKIVTNSGAHNTIYGPDGRRGLPGRAEVAAARRRRSRDATRSSQQVGPFAQRRSAPSRSTARRRSCFVNVNDLLGFEVGDLKTGKMLHRVEVTGFEKGPVKRHGCPSHGVGAHARREGALAGRRRQQRGPHLRRDVMPPRQVATIKLRDQPGWITFSLDGRYAYPSTGEIIDTRTRKIVATLTDEMRRAVQSEKVVEVVFAGGKPVRDRRSVRHRPEPIDHYHHDDATLVTV